MRYAHGKGEEAIGLYAESTPHSRLRRAKTAWRTAPKPCAGRSYGRRFP
jgi:hypothetical protein